MSKNYLVPDDPAFKENKADPFPSARKKSTEPEAGKITNAYLKQRQKDYRKYGVGSPLSISLSSSKTEQEKILSHSVVPVATKKGTIYVNRKNTRAPKSDSKTKKPSKQAKRINRFKNGLRNG